MFYVLYPFVTYLLTFPRTLQNVCYVNKVLGKRKLGASRDTHKKTEGFPPTGEIVRKLALQFAEGNEIPHHFNREKGTSGWDWLD
jgi:hypothetical protein